jgi:hypothetical protein
VPRSLLSSSAMALNPQSADRLCPRRWRRHTHVPSRHGPPRTFSARPDCQSQPKPREGVVPPLCRTHAVVAARVPRGGERIGSANRCRAGGLASGLRTGYGPDCQAAKPGRDWSAERFRSENRGEGSAGHRASLHARMVSGQDTLAMLRPGLDRFAHLGRRGVGKRHGLCPPPAQRSFHPPAQLSTRLSPRIRPTGVDHGSAQPRARATRAWLEGRPIARAVCRASVGAFAQNGW